MRSLWKGPFLFDNVQNAWLVSDMSWCSSSLVHASALFCFDGTQARFILHSYFISSQKICLQMSVKNICFEDPPSV